MTRTINRPVLAVIDDDIEISDFIKHVANEVGFDVEEYNNGSRFQKSLKDKKPGAIITDIVMPDMDGNELMMYLAGQNFSPPIILISGYGGKYLNISKDLAQAFGLNVIDTLAKPIGYDDLERVLINSIDIISKPASI